MLAKPYRLPPFERFDDSRNVYTKFFFIRYKANNSPHNRFGFVISKKIDKRAVARNRMRRMLGEITHRFIEEQPGKDILFVVKQSFIDLKIEEIMKIIQEALEKLT